MEEKLKTLHELCDVVAHELEEANEKIRKAGGKLSAGDVDYIDKLTHAMKSIKTTIAMMESEDDGYSNRYMPVHYGGSYAGGRNTRRDAMGQYSRTGGYSYADSMDDLLSEMRGMMHELPEEKRREVQRFVDKMERM